MESTNSNKITRLHSSSIDLPDFKVWSKLEAYCVKSSFYGDAVLKGKQIEKAENLMDEAFDSIIEKLIRQN